MKKTLFFGLVISLAMLTSCNSRDFDSSVDTWPQLRDESYSLCVEPRSTETSSGELKKEVHYFAIDNQTLKFEQSLIINCGCENVDVTMTVENNTIVINVQDFGISANCLCPGAATYEVSNLKENTSYSFVFKRKGEAQHTENITFTGRTDRTIKLD